MKTFLKSSASLLVLASFSVPALGADVYNGGSTKDAPDAFAAPSRVVNWTGFYIGGGVGYGNSNHDLTVQRYNGDYCWDVDGDGVNPIAPIDPTDPWAGSVDHATKEGHVDNRLADGSCDGEGFLGTDTGPYSDGTTTKPHGDGQNWAEDDHSEVDASKRNLANLDGVNSHGLVGDVRAGFDFAQGRFLFGVFGSYGFSDMEAKASIAGLGNAWIEKGDEWSLGARAGYIVAPSTLLYVLAAYTQTEYEFGVSGNGFSASKDITFDGITVGGGVEFALTQNVFLGVEGTHTFYGEETVFDTGASEIGGFGTRIVDDLDETKVMGTLKIKLNSGLGF